MHVQSIKRVTDRTVFLCMSNEQKKKNDYFLFFCGWCDLSKDGMTKYYQQLENADVKSVRNGMYIIVAKSTLICD